MLRMESFCEMNLCCFLKVLRWEECHRTHPTEGTRKVLATQEVYEVSTGAPSEKPIAGDLVQGVQDVCLAFVIATVLVRPMFACLALMSLSSFRLFFFKEAP